MMVLMLKVPSDWIVRDGEEKVMSMSCDQQYKDAKVCHHKQMFTKYIFIFWICIAKIFGLAIKVVFLWSYLIIYVTYFVFLEFILFLFEAWRLDCVGWPFGRYGRIHPGAYYPNIHSLIHVKGVSEKLFLSIGCHWRAKSSWMFTYHAREGKEAADL